MDNPEETLQTTSNEDNDDYEDNSDDKLEIDLESSSHKKDSFFYISENERDLVAEIEDEIEKRLEEKAAKTKLNVINVKNIIKQVLTNEHVLALFKKFENPGSCEDTVPVFEPKLTRAKARELAVSPIPLPTAPCESPEPVSEVQVLFTEELQEDSSGDEYVPGDEIVEKEDADSTVSSNPPSVEPPPQSPPPVEPSSNASTKTLSTTQTSWTDDGVFKIPWNKNKDQPADEATIAKRTRSKLCLSSTPLEVIEEMLIPPDITTDMYDMDCENKDWLDFIQKFARPLDEVEEEEQDPDFNVLADDEIDKPDKDEFRVDKAVKIPRRELNKLIAELFEYVDLGLEPSQKENAEDGTKIDETGGGTCPVDESVSASEVIEEAANEPVIIFDESQVVLLQLMEQHMRQHVQMLTQNFILTYQHPELHYMSLKLKEYLLNLKFLTEGKERSMFFTVNLVDALKLVEFWEELLISDTEDVRKMKLHVQETLSKSIRCRQTGTEFIVTFPPLMMETISKSSVFLYPALLPKIPFKSPKVFPTTSKFYTESEDRLIAYGLEQFLPLVKQDRTGKVTKKMVREACCYIQEYMLPYKHANLIFNHINMCKYSRCGDNPIKYFFQNNKPPTIVHYLDQLQVVPPCQRCPEDLPYQWKNFIYSSMKPSTNGISVSTSPIITVTPRNLFSTAINAVPSISVATSLPSLSLETNTQTVTSCSILTLETNTQTVTSCPILTVSPSTLIPVQLVPLHPVALDLKNITPTQPKRSTTRSKTLIHRQRKRRISKQNEKVVVPSQRGDPLTNFVRCLCRRSSIEKIGFLYSNDLDASDRTFELQSSTGEKERVPEASPDTGLTMLPSMPNLRTPIKTNEEEVPDEEAEKKNPISTSEKRNLCFEFSTISSSSFQQPTTSTEVEFCKKLDGSKETSTGFNINQSLGIERLKDDGRVDEETIDENNSLSMVSASVKPIARKEPSGAEKKRIKRKREFLGNLSVSTPESRDAEEQKNELFALAYYDKMRDTLDLDDYHKIMRILNDFETGDAVDLYRKVEVILRPKYLELADEFLLFLREKEAAAVDRLIPWIRMNNRSQFLRKLEIYFKDHPTQLKNIYKCLAELSQTVNVSMETIKSTLLPMFKGNEVLSDLFLQNFLDEPPPQSLMAGPFEEIDVGKEMLKNDEEEMYETVTVPRVEDKYGGQSCVCACHEIEDAEFQSRYRHCIKCGTKFINGRVYIQTGRGPRPATISFPNSHEIDHSARLSFKSSVIAGQNQKKKRSDTSPSKQIDEETDDEAGGKKKTKKKQQNTRKKLPDKFPDHKPARKGSVSKKTSPLASRIKSTTSTTARKRTHSTRKSSPKPEKGETEQEEDNNANVKPGATPGQLKRLADESLEWGEHSSAAGESSCDLKPGSSDQQTAESESEFCEESSQDNCESDSNSSVSSAEDGGCDGKLWTREEDKVILEVFQNENDKDNAFKVIALQLTDRTVEEIKWRFDTLMKLLLETIGKG